MKEMITCNYCKGTTELSPDYNESDKVKITLLGYCHKCGNGVYSVEFITK